MQSVFTFTYSTTHKLIDSALLAHSLTHSLTQLLTHSLTHSQTHKLTHSLTHSLTHPLTRSPTQLVGHAHTHSSNKPMTLTSSSKGPAAGRVLLSLTCLLMFSFHFRRPRASSSSCVAAKPRKLLQKPITALQSSKKQ